MWQFSIIWALIFTDVYLGRNYFSDVTKTAFCFSYSIFHHLTAMVQCWNEIELEVSLFFKFLYLCYHISIDLSKQNQKSKKSIFFHATSFLVGKCKSLITGGAVRGTY